MISRQALSQSEEMAEQFADGGAGRQAEQASEQEITDMHPSALPSRRWLVEG